MITTMTRPKHRVSVLNIPHPDNDITFETDSQNHDMHVEICYSCDECAITSERLNHARISFKVSDSNIDCSALSTEELKCLQREQCKIQKTLLLKPGKFDEIEEDGQSKERRNGVDLKDRQQPKPQDAKEASHVEGKRRFESFLNAQIRSRFVRKEDGVLGVQGSSALLRKTNSLLENKITRPSIFTEQDREDGDDKCEEVKDMDITDCSYVRKPDLAKIVEEYERLEHHPKYSLKHVLLSRRFHLYKHRFGNAQYKQTLLHPTLPQPKELFICGSCKKEEGRPSEKYRTRRKGHRFIITADTQFGVLMDGFAMKSPNWCQEIEISRKCVEQINAMTGDKRPLFVCVCGDLVDTESSFSGAIASWKKVMSGWERNLVFDQQVRDFKRVWANLDPDIALVCLCGNHDVGNRPTKESISHWTSAFGDDYLSFWANGSFNICLNSCLFSNPNGAQELFDQQFSWMEERLKYATENNATHIFVYGHFPWFLKHEDEADDELVSYSAAPPGWGPPGSRFEDGYFTIPLTQRKPAMELFKKYNVTACFTGHFHQNVVTETTWGMPMIVTGPLSMNLESEISHELSRGEVNGIGMRIVDVGEMGEFTHKWILLDDEESLFERALGHCTNKSDVLKLMKWRGQEAEDNE